MEEKQTQVKELLGQMINLISSYDQLITTEKNLGCVDGRIIGTGRADYTQGATIYNLSIEDKTFALIDIPGIEGDESKYENIIRESLDKAHVIFYVNGSGKKIEHATLDKVKKYMHDGTSVYALFNVHCKAKKERLEGIDKTFDEELELAYRKQDEIISQTEKELVGFLGKNYKGSLTLNGLLSFCGFAINNNGKTTIVDEEDKHLRTDQKKYLKEYACESEKLIEDSHIGLVQDIITDKIENFESYIYDENIKKLKNRLHEMIIKIDTLKEVETTKIKGFITIYNEFESNCKNAKEDFIQTMNHVGYNAAVDGFADVKAELFQMIETEKGKTDSKKIQRYFEHHKDSIVKEIEQSLNDRIKQAQEDYEETINDARRRLIKDIEREQTKFEISLDSEDVKLDDSFVKAMKYKINSGDLFKVGALAFSFAALGSFFPVIGTVIGGAIGAVLGVLSSLLGFFANEATRINNAKERLQRTIDEQVDKVSDNIKQEMRQLEYETKINIAHNQLIDQIDRQKAALEAVERLLNTISKELTRNYKKLS